jgi:hypothetical protein
MSKPNEPKFKTENGKKIYTGMECRIDSVIRPHKPPPKPVQANNEAAGAGADPTDTGDSTESGSTGAPDRGGGNVVRAPCRLISCVDAWPNMGGYGPTFVRWGHLNGQAIRQIPDLMNSAARPTPLMWNHSMDMRDKCGKVENAYWEDSTDIPPGVTADLVVNRDYDSKAATGLETGEIDASSIGIVCDYEMSHPDMDFWTFMDLQGRNVDGKLVAWLPVTCEAVVHHALVCAGADPFSGPRAEQNATENSAAAVTNNQSQGGWGMEEKYLKLVMAVCNALGVSRTLVAGQEPPADLEKTLTDKAAALNGAVVKHNDMASKLEGLGASLLKEGEVSLNANQVLERLPERIQMAKHGEAFLAHQQKEAVTWFDRANADPKVENSLTESQKLLRGHIEASPDLKYLAAVIAENKAAAEKRFGTGGGNRTSLATDPPGSAENQLTPAQAAAVASIERMKKGGKA